MKDDEKVIAAIKGAVDKTGRYPFLFIGSGLSKRYMGTPSWDELLKEVCLKTLGDPFSYARYLSEAKIAVSKGEVESELPYVATLMEAPVGEALLSSPEFSDFREKHFDWLQGGGSPMRRYISDLFSSYTLAACPESTLLSEAGKSKVSGVITTNYDGLCSELFPSFVSYVGEDDLLFRDPTYAQEIYQIHGSMDKPDSLVLTDSDYRKFSDREKYLAAKLLTIFVEYPIVFLGYSIRDPNIASILSAISKCVGSERLSNLQDRLIFVKWEKDAEPSIGSQLMTFDGQAIGMTGVTTGDFLPVFRGLAESQKLYDTRALRELRGSIFSIVPRLDARSQTVVASIDRAIDTLGEDDKVVIGFGQEPTDYGKAVKHTDLYRDIVLDDMLLPAALVVYQYLGDILKNNSGAAPVYKYLDQVGVSVEECSDIDPYLEDYVGKHGSIESFLSRSQREQCRAYRRSKSGPLSIDRLIEDEGADRAFQFVKYLKEDEIDIDALRSYLASLLKGEDGSVSTKMLETDTYKSEYRKCVRIYDFIRYRYGKSPGLR